MEIHWILNDGKESDCVLPRVIFIYFFESVARLPPKFEKSAVRSDKLKFQSCPNDLVPSLGCPTSSDPSCSPPVCVASDGKVDSRADASMPIPDISGVKGK